MIEIKTLFQQKMLVKHHLTCRLHVLTLLNQQMLYNKYIIILLLLFYVWTCSRGLDFSEIKEFFAARAPLVINVSSYVTVEFITILFARW